MFVDCWVSPKNKITTSAVTTETTLTIEPPTQQHSAADMVTDKHLSVINQRQADAVPTISAVNHSRRVWKSKLWDITARRTSHKHSDNACTVETSVLPIHKSRIRQGSDMESKTQTCTKIRITSLYLKTLQWSVKIKIAIVEFSLIFSFIWRFNLEAVVWWYIHPTPSLTILGEIPKAEKFCSCVKLRIIVGFPVRCRLLKMDIATLLFFDSHSSQNHLFSLNQQKISVVYNKFLQYYNWTNECFWNNFDSKVIFSFGSVLGIWVDTEGTCLLCHGYNSVSCITPIVDGRFEISHTAKLSPILNSVVEFKLTNINIILLVRHTVHQCIY